MNHDHKPTAAHFYDFDRTFTITDFGTQIIALCDPFCSYERCNCDGPGELVATLRNQNNAYQLVIDALGGEARKQMIANHLQKANQKCQKRFIVSTSYYNIPAKEWGDFIFTTFQVGGLGWLVPRDIVLTLDDPGEGIAADKGAVVAETLAGISLTAEYGIFMD